MAFLAGGRSQNQRAVIAVAAAARSLKIVALSGAQIAQAGAAPGHVHQHAGKFAARHIRQPFLHKRYAGPGRRHQSPHPAGARAQQHIDGGNLAFGLDKLPSLFRQQGGEQFGNFILRRDGIAEIAAYPGGQSAVDHGFIAFEQPAFAHAAPPLFHTRMATSGQTRAHEAQPTHSAMRSGGNSAAL